MIGTRPEAIKLAPVARALQARGLDCCLILTGQHDGLDPADFGLAEFAALRLGCIGQTNPYAHAVAVERALTKRLNDAPSLIVVQGDTSSAFAAASAAFAAGIAVAHVEAGLRTHDAATPWPEEEFRTAIDARATLLFAPTETAAANLAKERIRGEVHVTGNSGIDAVLDTLAQLPAPTLRDSAVKRLLVTCHRRESWGDGLAEIATAITTLAARGDVVIDLILHPNPRVAGPLRERLRHLSAVNLIGPLPHAELVERMRSVCLILSDSGGIQEEAPALGVPLLVLRDKTERPEGLASGNSQLVGVSAAGIVAAANVLLDDPRALAALSRPSLPFGDGQASGRIAAQIERWLSTRRRRIQRLA